MNAKIEAALSEQINREFYSSYLYLAMAGWAEAQHRAGFAHWLSLQATEEYGHAMKLIKYVRDRGACVELKAIAAPPQTFKGLIDIFEQTLGHEQKVTQHVHDLYELALKQKDYPTQIELQWFISEQVEEEKNAGDILAQLQLSKETPQALMSLDRMMAMRAAKG
jgi:ferritin